MEIVILKNADKATKYATFLIIKQIGKKKNSTLGLASGRTMVPLYKFLTEYYGMGRVDFSKIKTFNLDEYYGSAFFDKKSLRRFMQENFFNGVNLAENSINFLDGGDKKWRVVCKNYESEIRKAGGIDLQILGIGRNGHIGFNEPGSLENSKTRKVKLTGETRGVNGVKYKEALTMGISTILKARKILLLAAGKEKAEIMKKVIEGKIGKEVPASFLRNHKDVVFIMDREAAGRLKRFK